MSKKLSLHQHTTYSDGLNSIYGVSKALKENGFCCSVITDHCYMIIGGVPRYLDQLEEAKRVSEEELGGFPIICGLEITLGGEEGLLFNKDMCIEWLGGVKERYLNGKKNGEDNSFLKNWLSSHEPNFGLVLCHPNLYYDTSPDFYSMFHAYEIVNGGHMWPDETIERLRIIMPNAKEVRNYDLHNADCLKPEYKNIYYTIRSYNEVDIEVTDEKDIIKWIRTR